MMDSEKKHSNKSYLGAFAITTIVILFSIGLVSYIVDPFFQFRVNTEDHYLLNPRFVNGGLAHNYDYNTVLIGSSMVQNFDVSILHKNNSEVKPVKLAAGGMNVDELEYIYSLVDKEKAKNIIINIDMPPFNLLFQEVRYPTYLYEDSWLNKLKYLYGYETVVQFIPVDIGLSVYLKNKKNVPDSYRLRTSIDNIGNDSYSKLYSAENVKQQYLSGIAVSPQGLIDIESRMANRLDSLLVRLNINKHKGTNYTFLFPSYSALYWYHAQRYDYYVPFMNFVRLFANKVEKYKNVRIAFFLDRKEITDLNYYSDITHFGPVLSNITLEDIYKSDCVVKAVDIDKRIQRLDSLVRVFVEENKDWLPKNE